MVSVGLGRRIAQAASSTPATVMPATILSIDWASKLAVVNVAGGEIRAQWSGTAPRLNDFANVLLYAGGAIILGSPGGPALGTVVDGTVVPTDTGDTVDVLGEDGIVHPLYFSVDYTPVADDLVLISWEARGHILIPISGRAADPDAAVPPPAGPVEHEQIFRPLDSASWRSGGWQTTDVVFGESYPFGGFFYGPQIADSIADTASILAVSTYIEVTQSFGAATALLGLHAEQFRPGGPPALDNLINIGAVPAGFAAEIALPNEWGDLLKTGERRGIGTAGSGFRVMRGVTGGSSQGAVKIRWTE